MKVWQNYNKLCGHWPRDNESCCNEMPATRNRFWRSQRTIYPAITNILSCRSQSVKTTWWCNWLISQTRLLLVKTGKLWPSKLCFRPSKKTHVSRPDFCKKKGRAGFFCYLLSPIDTLLPSLRSNINKTKHQILIKTSFFNVDTHKGLTVKIYILLVCKQQQWALQVTSVGFCS